MLRCLESAVVGVVAGIMLLWGCYTSIAADCNRNGVADIEDIQSGAREDCNQNGVPDECDLLVTKFLSTLPKPIFTAIADVNGDGKPDLVIGNQQWPNAIAVHLNSGGGNFQSQIEVPNDDIPFGMAVSDFDGDQDPDIALTMGQHLRVLLNDHDGHNVSFSSITSETFQNPYVPFAGDFNNDDSVDLALSGRRFLINYGDGSFAFQVPNPIDIPEEEAGESILAVGDFDRDGDLDLVTESWTHFNLGNLTFEPVKHNLFQDRIVDAVATGDIDVDGDLDLVGTVVSELPRGALIIRSDGIGGFITDSLLSGIGGSIVVSDANSDGMLDIVGAGSLSLNAGGTFLLPLETPPYGYPRLAGDLDGDGMDEFAYFDEVRIRLVTLPAIVDLLSIGCVADWKSLVGHMCPIPRFGDTNLANPWDYLVDTDAFSLEIGSASGAVGDVVEVTISLTSQLRNPGWLDFSLAVCHDPKVAQIAGRPIYTEKFASLMGVGGPEFHTIDEGVEPGDPKGHGFILYVGLDPEAYNARFPSDLPLPLMTVYYRIKGDVGTSGKVGFCDFTLARWNLKCNYNMIHAVTGDHQQGYDYLPKAKGEGTLTVLPGPATHPDVPPEPTPAKVYPDRPSVEDADFRVRIDGADASRRSVGTEVTVELYVTAAVEYAGIFLPIAFDKRYLMLDEEKSVQHFGGVLSTNYPSGNKSGDYVVIYGGLGTGSPRLAAEHEEVHAATLYFYVLQAANRVAQTAVKMGGPGRPGILVWYLDQGVAVRDFIEPVASSEGIISLGEIRVGLVGDANADGQIDISDPLALLSYLFLGNSEPACLGAADFNLDGELDLTDAVAILGTLFLGASVPGGEERREVDCR